VSLLDKITGNRPTRAYPRHVTFRLTASGGDKLQDYSGDPQSRVLIALETLKSSANLEEIARTSRLSVGQVERIIPRLVRAGFVTPASAADGDVF